MSLILDGTNGLSDVDGTAATPAIRGTDANTGIFFPAADTIAFSEGGTEVARFDSAGNLAVGITSAGFRITAASASASNGIVAQFQNSGSTGCGVNFAQNGVDDFSLTMPAGTGGLRFIASGTNERMRIDSSGNLLVGMTTALGSGVNSSSNYWVGTASQFWKTTNFSATYYFAYNGADKATINGSTGAYTALSDANKKKDFEPSTVGLDAVMALKPTLFRMFDDEETAEKQLGFLAQDVKNVIPQAYTEQDAPDGKFIGLQDRPIIAVLVKAVQELKATVDAQAKRIVALENLSAQS
jgi:hypothetical protein